MKVQATKYTLSVLLLASSAFLCHCTQDWPTTVPRPDKEKKSASRMELLTAYYQNLVLQQSSIAHNIAVDDFKVGYEVSLQIRAPSTGLFALDLYDGSGNVILHIVAR